MQIMLCPCYDRKLETETSPTEEWSAGHKVVPGNRARKFMTNNQTDYTFRLTQCSGYSGDR